MRWLNCNRSLQWVVITPQHQVDGICTKGPQLEVSHCFHDRTLGVLKERSEGKTYLTKNLAYIALGEHVLVANNDE